MSRIAHAVTYTSPDAHTQTHSSLSVQPHYPVNTVEDVAKAINGGIPGEASYVRRASAVPFEFTGGGSLRLNLSMAVVGTGDVVETLYGARRIAGDDDKGGIQLEEIGTIIWSATGEAIEIPASVGGRTGHKHADVVVGTYTDRLLAETGLDPRDDSSTEVAQVTIYDVASYVGFIRLVGLPDGAPPTSGTPRHAKWR